MTVNWITELLDYSENFVARVTTDSIKYVLAFIGAFAVALLLTPLCRELARKVGMVDHPDARRINKTPIPRGGGFSVFVAFHGTLTVLALVLGSPISTKFSYAWQWRFLCASSLLVLIGLVDDRFGMRPVVKLFGQIAVATILFFSGVSLGGIVVAFPPWLNYLATVIWIVGAVNAFNLIDGMDGLATGLALIAALGLAGSLLFTGNSIETLPYLVFAGACLGFLRYNFHPASVFLGDTGSMFLGLCVATLPLMTGSRKELVASIGVPMLAMGVPIFDTMLAIWRRTVRALLPAGIVTAAGARVRLMQPDKDHVHHRLLRDTMNQRTVAAILYGISATLVAIGLVGTLLRGRAPGLFLIAFIVAIYVVVRHLVRVELWDTGRLFSAERGLIRHGVLVPLSIIADVFALCGVWTLSRWLSGMPIGRVAFLSNLPLYVVPVFVMLVGSKTYWRVWSRAQIRDFAGLVTALLAGSLLGLGLVWLVNEVEPHMIRFTVLFGALSVIPVVGMRLWRDSVQGLMQVLERRVLMEKPETLRMLVYGGGLRFRGYLRELMRLSGRNDRVIIGVVDDDIQLKGRIVAGFHVLGTGAELEALVAEHRVDGVIITCLMEADKQAKVAKRLEALGVLVSVWTCDENVVADPHHLLVPEKSP